MRKIQFKSSFTLLNGFSILSSYGGDESYKNQVPVYFDWIRAKPVPKNKKASIPNEIGAFSHLKLFKYQIVGNIPTHNQRTCRNEVH